ncbi:mechanosensitive ion channel family protein [uncultured Dokdonia sp.]|uniref:mechanosensitive ion channel family protein n=1 Tax=uncultured Dokdonia sp. TaxID=575653 RepID=UPI00260A7CAC|nr:mechanosensitive ion channel family protein [uncultured Dokdonia sp.]
MTEKIQQIVDKVSNWGEILILNAPNIFLAILVMIATYFSSKFVYNIVLKLIYKRIQQTSITRLIARFSSVVIVATGLFLTLSVLNLSGTLKTILSAAGISGLVIGLALQGTLSNTISGIILSFRKNIKIGNWIETNGYTGEVVDINTNYFVMKEADNNIVVLPNKSIIENPFKNYSLTSKMRVTIHCGISYNSDLELVESLTKHTIDNNFNQDSLNTEVEFYYTEFGDSSINFMTRFWIDATSGLQKLKAKSKAIIEIKKAFAKANIDIPFPIRTLQFDNTPTLTISKRHAEAELN